MAPRKNDTIERVFRFLVAAPWWVGPPLAGLVFVFFRFLAPFMMNAVVSGGADSIGRNMILPSLAFFVAIAPVAGGGVILLWLVALLWKLQDAQRLDGITGPDSIRKLPWQEFERLVGEAFRREGYFADVTGTDCGDGGIDIVLERDGEKTLVQCKHWKAWSVGVQPVRELLGVVTSEHACRGIVVTSGDFTPEAQAFAEHNPITLVAGKELVRMIRAVQKRRSRSSESPGGESPSPTSARRSPITNAATLPCPACGSPMVRRIARKGPRTGQSFWGCSRYPDCRGIRQIEPQVTGTP